MIENDGVRLLLDAERLNNSEDNQTVVFGTAVSLRQKQFHLVSFLQVSSSV